MTTATNKQGAILTAMSSSQSKGRRCPTAEYRGDEGRAQRRGVACAPRGPYGQLKPQSFVHSPTQRESQAVWQQ